MNFLKKIAEAVRGYDDTHNFTCDICSREIFDGKRVCSACYKELPFVAPPVCPLCGRKVGEEGICLECKQKPLTVYKARSVFTHEGEAMRLIHRFKQGEKYLYRTAAELMLPLLKKEFPDADGLVFVPMTKRAQKKRGYNQSRLMAEELSRRAELPLFDVAEKKKDTEQQKTLGRMEREKNLEGCFHVTERAAVKGKELVIVDDTLTTGATVSELASVLLRAGAKRVGALTLSGVRFAAPFGIKEEK